LATTVSLRSAVVLEDELVSPPPPHPNRAAATDTKLNQRMG
jgi:hypothetical protein